VGDFFGVDAVVLVFAAVNGLEVERVGEDKGQVRGLAGIGQPIPAEHAFGADGQVVTVRGHELEEVVEVVVLDVGVDELFAVPVHEADVHLPGVEVDSAVELSGGGVIHRVVVHCARSDYPTRCRVGRSLKRRGKCVRLIRSRRLRGPLWI